MAEKLKTSVPGYTHTMGLATLSTSSDADDAQIAIQTGMTIALSAHATLVAAPSGVSAPIIWRTISGGTVTFHASNVDSVVIDYHIMGLV